MYCIVFIVLEKSFVYEFYWYFLTIYLIKCFRMTQAMLYCYKRISREQSVSYFIYTNFRVNGAKCLVVSRFRISPNSHLCRAIFNLFAT